MIQASAASLKAAAHVALGHKRTYAVQKPMSALAPKADMCSAVRVSNAAGAQTLNRPGQGTNIARPGAAPGPITSWPQDKVNRAITAVTFQ
jgi:hypothetical protein